MQEIRKEELHLKDNEALIPVAHFHKVSWGIADLQVQGFKWQAQGKLLLNLHDV